MKCVRPCSTTLPFSSNHDFPAFSQLGSSGKAFSRSAKSHFTAVTSSKFLPVKFTSQSAMACRRLRNQVSILVISCTCSMEKSSSRRLYYLTELITSTSRGAGLQICC
ncbi:hypothetical protein PF006_g8830, partial [Phytophthora fragariae]